MRLPQHKAVEVPIRAAVIMFRLPTIRAELAASLLVPVDTTKLALTLWLHIQYQLSSCTFILKGRDNDHNVSDSLKVIYGHYGL